MQIRLLGVLRDAFALVIASALARAVALGIEASDAAVAWIVFAVFAAGFCASGCLSPERRWTHLSLVALASWVLLVAIGVLTGGVGSAGLFIGFIVNPLLLALLVGGAASLAIVRRAKVP
jgi:hypothetical protein